MASQTTLRLPEDLDRLIDPALARRPPGLTTACYTFPHYHRSAFNDRILAPGWTEYSLMRGARPWFGGHHQPRTPLLGELDEADPATWKTYVDLAVDSGIDAFIFDWYWYGGEPALHEALEHGFLRAPGRERMRFAVMWTNHPWMIWFPTAGAQIAPEWPDVQDQSGLGAFEPVDPGPQSMVDVWRGLAYIVARYFHDPHYWRIDDRPVLVIWDMALLVRTFGLAEVVALFDDLRSFARKLGHAGMHVHASMGGWPSDEEMRAAGVNSYGLYNSVVAASGLRPDEEQLPEYGVVAADIVARRWPADMSRSSLPYFPCISPGWDDSPRHRLLAPGSGAASRRAWPRMPLVVDESPAAFEALARAALALLNMHPEIPPVLLIGTWNEWTEGHYLLPDTRLGFGMARALARVLQDA